MAKSSKRNKQGFMYRAMRFLTGTDSEYLPAFLGIGYDVNPNANTGFLNKPLPAPTGSSIDALKSDWNTRLEQKKADGSIAASNIQSNGLFEAVSRIKDKNMQKEAAQNLSTFLKSNPDSLSKTTLNMLSMLYGTK